jgi:hypothetical protein
VDRGQVQALEQIVEVLGDAKRANDLLGWCNAVRRLFADAHISDVSVRGEFSEHFGAFYNDVQRLRTTADVLRAWAQRTLAADAVAGDEP